MDLDDNYLEKTTKPEREPEQLQPLKRADEAKVRAEVQLLSAEHANVLGDMIGTLIKKIREENNDPQRQKNIRGGKNRQARIDAERAKQQRSPMHKLRQTGQNLKKKAVGFGKKLATTSVQPGDRFGAQRSNLRAAQSEGLDTTRFSDFLLEIEMTRIQRSENALKKLLGYAKQLHFEPAKFGSFVMLVLEQLILGDDQPEATAAFRKQVEDEFGTYYNQPLEKEQPTAPGFKTRGDARKFTKDQNALRATHRVVDAGKGAKNRWRSEVT